MSFRGRKDNSVPGVLYVRGREHLYSVFRYGYGDDDIIKKNEIVALFTSESYPCPAVCRAIYSLRIYFINYPAKMGRTEQI